MLLRLLIVIRVLAFGQATMLLALNWRTSTDPAAALLALCTLGVGSVLLFAVYLRRGVAHGAVLAPIDAGLGIAALLASVVLLRTTANPIADDFLYPYTVAAMSVTGMAYRRVTMPLIAATLATAGLLAGMIFRFRVVGLPELAADSSSYWAWSLGSWLLATQFRNLSAQLDQARTAEIKREREMSRRREGAKISRKLHDRTVQALEFASRSQLIADPKLRDQLAAEAIWLRTLIRQGLGEPNPELASSLARVVAQQTGTGMRIELNVAQLSRDALAGEAVVALSDAVEELLTNVRKHSGTMRVILRATSRAGRVTVTVLDRGRGFDPGRTAWGLGLHESVIMRIRDVGGTAVIWSEPGAGTYAELSVPGAAVGEPRSAPGQSRTDLAASGTPTGPGRI